MNKLEYHWLPNNYMLLTNWFDRIDMKHGALHDAATQNVLKLNTQKNPFALLPKILLYYYLRAHVDTQQIDQRT